jgi:hypothetical protein
MTDVLTLDDVVDLRDDDVHEIFLALALREMPNESRRK